MRNEKNKVKKIFESQSGSRKGRSCIDTAILKIIIDKRTDFNLESYLVLINCEYVFHKFERHFTCCTAR